MNMPSRIEARHATGGPSRGGSSGKALPNARIAEQLTPVFS